jgi:mono/diheme cytochrome c family protein
MKPDRNKQAVPAQPPSRSNAADAEPSAAHIKAAPVWLFVFFALLLFVGMQYLDNHAGGFNPHVYQYYFSSNQLVRFQPADESAKGMGVYSRTCIACHQLNGQGTPGQFPSLVGSEWVLEENPARMIRIILNGLQGPIQIKGQQFSNVMVPWKDTLNDEDIAAVASYVRKAWGNNAPSVKTEQVAAIRKETSNRSTAWTADELLKVSVAKK